jgi:hypothetical protein
LMDVCPAIWTRKILINSAYFDDGATFSHGEWQPSSTKSAQEPHFREQVKGSCGRHRRHASRRGQAPRGPQGLCPAAATLGRRTQLRLGQPLPSARSRLRASSRDLGGAPFRRLHLSLVPKTAQVDRWFITGSLAAPNSVQWRGAPSDETLRDGH